MSVPMFKKEYKTFEIRGMDAHRSSFTAAVEETIVLYVNNRHIANILATPKQLEQLAMGYLVAEGIVQDPADIRSIDIKDNRIFVEIALTDDFELWFEIRSSGCIGVNWESNEDIAVESDVIFSPEVINGSLHYIESEIYQLTRGTHAACLIDQAGNCVARAVDVGRHNAVDKAIGQGLMDNFDPGRHFLLSTGRQPAGMILKAARSGIPVVVTKTAPLNSGIETAMRTGICLIGFASQHGMTVFVNPWRLEGLSDQEN